MCDKTLYFIFSVSCDHRIEDSLKTILSCKLQFAIKEKKMEKLLNILFKFYFCRTF